MGEREWLMPDSGASTVLVVLLVGLPTIAIGWRRPYPILLVLVLLVPFRNFVTRWLMVHTELSVGQITGLGRWWFALIAGLLVVAAIRWVQAWRAGAPRPRLWTVDILAGASILIAMVHTALSPQPDAALTSFRGYVQPMVVYFVARQFRPSRKELQWALVGLLIVGTLMAAFGLLQGLTWDEVDYRANGYVRQNGDLVTPPIHLRGILYVRPASTVSGPNELGVDMMVLSAVAILTAVFTRGAKRSAAAGLAVLFVLGLVMTYSRSSFLGYLVMLAALFFLLRRWILRRWRSFRQRTRALAVGAALLAALGLVAVGFISGFNLVLSRTLETLQTQYHYVDTVDAVRYLLAHPAGVGMGLVAPKGALSLLAVQARYHVEGSLLQIAMEMGVWGLALWLALFVAGVLHAGRQFRVVDSPSLRIVTGAAAAGWAGSLGAFVFLPLMQSISLMVWLWFLLGVACSADEIEAVWRRRAVPSPQAAPTMPPPYSAS
jgi:hypothetical protein